MPQKCHRCGIESTDGEVFIEHAWVSSENAKPYCPRCMARRRHQQRLVEMLAPGIYGIIGIVLLLRDSHSPMGFVLTNLLLLHLCLVATILPHELGHALAGRALGFNVPMISIGHGRILFSLRLLRLDVVFRLWPSGGFTVFGPNPAPGLQRLRYGVAIAAGPLTNLALGLAAWWLADVPTLFVNPHSAVHGAAIFIWANLWVMAENLIPRIVETAIGPLPSDGLQICQLLGIKVPGIQAARGGVGGPIVKWLGIAMLIVIGLVLIALGTLACTIRDLPAAGVAIAGLLAVAGFLPIWLAFKEYRRSPKPKSPTGTSTTNTDTHIQTAAWNNINSPYAHILSRYNAEVLESRAALNQTSHLVRNVEAELRAGNKERALKLVRQHVQRPSDNLWLRLVEIQLLLGCGLTDEASTVFEKFASDLNVSSPTRSVVAASFLHTLAASGHVDAARRRCEAYVAGAALTLEKVYVLDVLSFMPFSHRRADYLPEADRWSQLALSLQPASLTLKATRGAVLVGLGRHAEAQPLLEEVRDQSPHEHDKGIALVFLAHCAHAAGDFAKARLLGRLAIATNPTDWVQEECRQNGFYG